MLKVIVEYPGRSEEREIVDRMSGPPLPPVRAVVEPAQVLHARDVVRHIYVDDKIKEYVLDLVLATRDPSANGLADLRQLIAFGASPRASIYLITAAPSPRLPQGTRLRYPGGRETAGPRCLATPGDHHLRSRSGGDQQRRHRAADP